MNSSLWCAIVAALQVTTVADWITVFFTAVAAIATGIAATMAYRTWRTYQKMNTILERTNEINARMLYETRVSRLSQLAPMLKVWPDQIFRTKDDESGEKYWAIGRLEIDNKGPGDAFDLDVVGTFAKEKPSIPELKAGEKIFLEGLLAPMITGHRSEIVITVMYRDRHGNSWEAEYSRARSRARLSWERIHEALEPDRP